MSTSTEFSSVKHYSQEQVVGESPVARYVSAEDYDALMIAYRELDRQKSHAERKATDLEKVVSATQVILEAQQLPEQAWILPHPLVQSAVHLIETVGPSAPVVDYQHQAETLATNIEFEIQHFEETHTPARLQEFVKGARPLLRQMPRLPDFRTKSMRQYARLVEDLVTYAAMDDDDMTHESLREMLNEHASIFETELAAA